MSNPQRSAARGELDASAMALLHDATAAEAAHALAGAGVPAILLKGASLTAWLYPETTDRFSVDVDLLVPPADVDRAEDALRQIGFTPTEPRREDRHAWTLERTRSGMTIDLHRRLVGVGVSDNAAWLVLSQAVEPNVRSGVAIDVLAPEARAMHLALHAAQETPDKTKAVSDLDRALKMLSNQTWVAAHAFALRLDAEAAFAAGLRLLPEGARLAEQMGLSERMTPEVALRIGRSPDLSLSLNAMLELRGRRRIVFAAKRAFPPPAAMRAWTRIALRGRVGLAAAYGWRSIWLLTRFGPAARAVWSARVQSRR